MVLKFLGNSFELRMKYKMLSIDVLHDYINKMTLALACFIMKYGIKMQMQNTDKWGRGREGRVARI